MKDLQIQSLAEPAQSENAGKPRCRMSTDRDGDAICVLAVFPHVCEGMRDDRANCPQWYGGRA